MINTGRNLNLVVTAINQFAKDEVDRIFIRGMDAMVRVGQQRANWILEQDVFIYMYRTPKEFQKLTPEQISEYKQRVSRLAFAARGHKPWVAISYPSREYANSQLMPWNALKDAWMDALTVDYGMFNQTSAPLMELMKKTSTVRLLSSSIDLTFDVGGIPPSVANGTWNLPSGGVNWAPIASSVQGFVLSERPFPMDGRQVEDLFLRFDKGMVVQAVSTTHQDWVSEFLTRPGADKVGEFSFGLNPFLPHIDHPMFLEYWMGTARIALGRSHVDHPDTNSAEGISVHWDIPFSMKNVRMYFDDILVWKDGRFVHPKLLILNPPQAA
ncbi:aminopeptidase [Patescibacteria group bacterium]|nr:aminopeptidase [Patescibacteria group bacterium]